MSQDRTANLYCAEPRCRRRITPRKGATKFFLHCDSHKTKNSGVPIGYPPPPSDKWGRYQCEACCAYFEWYRSSAERGSTDRLFCNIACRSEVGSKPTKLARKRCKHLKCPRPGRWFQPRMPDKVFCSISCHKAWKREQPKTRKRPQTPTEKDWAERLVCNWPECEEFAPPRDPSNGYHPVRCEEHEDLRLGIKRGPAADTRTIIECSRPWCTNKKERYKSAVNQEGNLFCSNACAAAHPGDRWFPNSGYVMVYAPGHSEAQANGWAMEHRVVMAAHLGRDLAEGSTVHHKNKNRSDNRIENLEYWLGNHGAGARHDDVVHHLLTVIAEMSPERADELSRMYGGPASTASYLPSPLA